jgi:hypothetical protein
MATDTEIGIARTRYDAGTVERALWALALNGGNGARTVDHLAAQGIHVPRTTILTWREVHADRYAKIQAEASDQLAEKIAADAEAFMVNAARVEALALEKLGEQIEAGQVKDVGSALRNVSTSKALNNDKIASPLRGRPSRIVEDRTPEQSFKRLAKLVPGLIVDSTAQEIQDAETIERPASPSAIDRKGT